MLKIRNTVRKMHWIDWMLIGLIVGVMIAISFTGSSMAKTYEKQVNDATEKQIGLAADEGVDLACKSMASVLDAIKIVKAPSVVGFNIKEAKKKLKKADVDLSAVTIEKKKYTFEKLVEESDTLFFGEVESQKQSKTDLTLTIAEADKKDELTREMLRFGGRLAWPVPDSQRVTSSFGGRKSPGGIGSTNHKGMDIAAATGTPIIAVKEGVVKTASVSGGYGNCVTIDHENGYETLYGHMSRITCKEGDRVKPGDVIGRVGSTGISTGPHLHFGLLRDGEFVDPEPYFTGKLNVDAGDELGEPEDPEDMEDMQEPSENSTEKETRPDNTKPEKTKPTKVKDKETEPSEEPETPSGTEPVPPAPEPEPEPAPEPATEAPQPSEEAH